MHITDPIADMLTRVRNAGSARHATVDVPASSVKKAIAQILMENNAAQVSDHTIRLAPVSYAILKI